MAIFEGAGVAIVTPFYANGEINFDKLEELVEECVKILSPKAKYMIINSYTTGLSSIVTGNLLELHVRSERGGNIEADNLVIPVEQSSMYLPCGTTARWFTE